MATIQEKDIVLGSAGMLGQHLSETLRSQGRMVVEYDIKRNQSEDLRNCLVNLDGVTRVFFLAWEVGGAKFLHAQRTQISQLAYNTKLMSNVFDQLANFDGQIVFASSQMASDDQTIYGVQKRLGELWSNQIGAIPVRLWNVYGSLEEDSIRSHVMSDFVRQAGSTGIIQLMTTGVEKRKFLHLKDTSAGLIAASHIKPNEGLVYDLAPDRWTSIIDIAQMIGGFFGSRVIPGEIVGREIQPQKENIVPNWEPSVTLQNGLHSLCRNFDSWKLN